MLKALRLGCSGIVVGLAWLCGWGPEPAAVAAGQAQDFAPVTDEMLLDPDPADWLLLHRTYDHQSFSPLDQITRDNVGQLRLAWMRAMDEGPQEIRPLVFDGVMYIAHPSGDHLQAIDATTGDLIWDYERSLPRTCASTPRSARGRATWPSTAATCIT